MNKFAIGIATFALIVALGVAIHSYKAVDKPLAGATNFDTVEVSSEVGFANASTTNSVLTAASSTMTSFVKAQKLSIGSAQYMDSYYNDTGVPLYVFASVAGYNDGTASSSIRMNLFASTTGPSTIKSRYTYTALTDAINGANSFLMRNYIVATSTTATTTNNQMMRDISFGSGFITIPASGWLHFLVQQGDLLGSCTAGTEAGKCESATSTNRGIGDYFAIVYFFR